MGLAVFSVGLVDGRLAESFHEDWLVPSGGGWGEGGLNASTMRSPSRSKDFRNPFCLEGLDAISPGVVALWIWFPIGFLATVCKHRVVTVAVRCLRNAGKHHHRKLGAPVRAGLK
jgi:hypothetical protein